MRLAAFISGVFGTLGFGLSVLAGISAGNTIESVLMRGLLSAVACYAVGYFVGLIAQQVSMEHAQHVARLVAEQDARDEAQRLEEQAARDAEAAQAAAAVGGGAESAPSATATAAIVN